MLLALAGIESTIYEAKKKNTKCSELQRVRVVLR